MLKKGRDMVELGAEEESFALLVWVGFKQLL